MNLLKKISWKMVIIVLVSMFVGAGFNEGNQLEIVDTQEYKDLLEEYTKLEVEYAKFVDYARENLQPIEQTVEAAEKEEVVDKIVFEDDKIKISFVSVDSKGVKFLAENKTEKVLTVQADSVAINGFSVNQIIMSDDVSPKSKGYITAKCDMPEKNAETVSGQLTIIDFNTMDSNKATFTNVPVK